MKDKKKKPDEVCPVQEEEIMEDFSEEGDEYFEDLSDMRIGLRLKKIRSELDMSQDYFAKLIGISPSYLSAIERGKRNISARLCTIIHEHTGLSCDYILTGQSDEVHYNYDRGFSPFPAELYEQGEYMAGPAKSISPAKKRLALLFNTCTEEEAFLCYSVCHTMLAEVRGNSTEEKRRKKRK